MEKLRLPALIKKINAKKLILPILFFCFAAFIFFSTPLYRILSVKSMSTPQEAASAYLNGSIYVRTSLSDLYYTGVNRMEGRDIHACYYYNISGNNCYYILISAKSLGLSEENPMPPDYLDRYSCMARLEQNPAEIARLTDLVSDSLGWTSQALNLMSSQVLINQHSMSHNKEYIFLAFMAAAAVFALGHLIFVSVSLARPDKSLTALRLSRYGKAKNLFASACGEYEKSRPYAPGITLTDNFFIAYDKHNVHIVPLEVIIWAYKFGTMHGRLLHPHISYSLSVVANNRTHYIVHHKTREAVDLALNALQTRFPEILIGYTEGRRIDKKY